MIVYVANWAVSSLMFTEGKSRHLFIMFCYTLVPYTIFELIYIIASNFVSNDMQAFLTMIRFLGFFWSGIVLFFGEYMVQQMSVGKVIINLILTGIGVAIILFLILLGYALVQQIITFAYTIYSEIVFRI